MRGEQAAGQGSGGPPEGGAGTSHTKVPSAAVYPPRLLAADVWPGVCELGPVSIEGEDAGRSQQRLRRTVVHGRRGGERWVME